MIIVGKVLVSDDIGNSEFLCNLEACKGACCVDGDLGAPLEDDELPVLDELYKDIEPYLTEKGKKAIKKHGRYVLDDDDEYSTPTVGGKECAYAVKDEKGIWKCGIEKAYLAGKTDFRKPISCHLYPLRSKKLAEAEGLNYDHWDICDPACSLGKELKIPLYKFVKEALIRKYGKAWYEELENVLEKEKVKS